MSRPPDDLALVPTADLLAELYGRYDCAVFAGLRTLGSDEEAEFGYAGGTYTGVGLARGLADYLTQQRALCLLAAEDDEDDDARADDD